MSTQVIQHPILWLLVALLGGAVLEWLLEVFFFRHRLFEAEARARRRGEELDSERFAHGRTQTELKAKLADLDAAQKGRTLAESLLSAARGKLSAAEADHAAARAERAQLDTELTTTVRKLDAAVADAGAQRAAVNDAQLRLAERDAEVATLTAAAGEGRENLARMSAEAEGAATRIPELQRQLESQITKAAALESDLQAALRRHADAEAALAELRGALTAAQDNLEATRSAKTALEVEKSALAATQKKLETAADDAKSAGSSAEQKLKARIQEVKQLSAQLGEAAEELAALKAKAAQAQANLEAATATRKTLEQELAAARATPASATDTPPADAAELAQVREQLREQERDAASWRSKAEEAEAELLGTSRAHQELVTEVERLRTASPSAAADEALAAELETMTRERNQLAAELAASRPRRKS